MPLHLKTGDGDLALIKEPALLTRCACISHAIYRPSLGYAHIAILFCVQDMNDAHFDIREICLECAGAGVARVEEQEFGFLQVAWRETFLRV